ncbi:MAG: hypothetical protein NT126_01400 [Bacteroidetes bacterium]|nr:hypothetical protein [Bacteroidota bacterium]
MKGIKIIVFVVIVLVSACKKAEQYSDIPSITFKSLTTAKDMTGYDVSGKITISFTDGDGDLGYYSSGNGLPFDDTLSQYYYNFIIKSSHLKNGNWIKDTLNLSGRMPYLTPDGTNKTLRGDIAMDLFLPPHKIRDTMRYDVFIYDRALHQSNTVTSSNLVITTH